MNILRRLGLSLVVLIFSLSISLFALFVGLYSLLSNPQPIKDALRSSGIYTNLVQNVLEQQATSSPSYMSTDPTIQTALTQAMPPTFLENTANNFLDGIYDWIEGKTESPRFSVDLSQVRANFANNIAIDVKQKLDSLPVCPDLIAPPASTGDALSLTCMPQGISSTAIANSARQEALDNSPFNGTFDASTLKDNQGRPLFASLTFVPAIYHYYVIALFLLPLCMGLCALAIVYLSATKRKGLKRMAWLLVSTGVGIMIIATLEVWLIRKGVSLLSSISNSNTTLQEKGTTIVETLVTDMRTWWFVAGAAYTLIGITTLIIVKLNPPKVTPLVPTSSNGELPPVAPTQTPPTFPIPPSV